MKNNNIEYIYSLIDDENFEEIENNIDYLTTNELTNLFNYLNEICPNKRLMNIIEEEIAVRTFSVTPDEYNEDIEYIFYE